MLLEFFLPRMLVPFIVLCLLPLTRLSFDCRDGPQVVTNPPLPGQSLPVHSPIRVGVFPFEDCTLPANKLSPICRASVLGSGAHAYVRACVRACGGTCV